jgi:hypothetical protein
MYGIIYEDDNKITNIEKLQFMKADKLEELRIARNFISRCKSFIKTNFDLSLLDLSI